MNRFFIPLVALILYTSAKAQDSELPKQYFDKDWTPLTGSEGATYYRTLEKKESLTVVRDYYISGKIETVSEQKFNGKKMVRDGKTIEYYENGAVEHEGDYRDGDEQGTHRYYYPDAKPRMETTTDAKYNTVYKHFWSPEGVEMLPGGEGTILVRTNSERHFFHVIVNSVTEATFAVQLSNQDTVFAMTTNPGEYKGGMNALVKDIGRTLHYPASARRGGKEGTVFVSMVIRKDGKLADTSVLKGFDPECDAEALRTINALDNWKPGLFEGKPVNSQFVMPIKFKLSGSRR